MKSNPKNMKPSADARSLPLGRVLNQTEEIKSNMEESAGSLAEVNEILKQEQKAGPSFQIVEDAVAQNKAIESQVKKAAGDLNRVNTELAKEVRDRADFESEFTDMKTDLDESRADLSKCLAKDKKIRQIMFQDALTGLPNRVLFEQRLKHGLIQAKRRGWKLAVLFIDIDKFKSINDSYGHDQGDKVLNMVANRLLSSVRSEDTVSRWGGDEFVCILLNIKQETDAAHIAEKMILRVAEPFDLDETVLCLKISVGIAVYPGDGETPDILFKNADRAMYQAKETEKGVVFFCETAC